MKDRKQGKVTALQLTENLHESVKQGSIKRVVYVVLDEDDIIKTGYNHGNNLETVGMLEIAKQEIVDEMGG